MSTEKRRFSAFEKIKKILTGFFRFGRYHGIMLAEYQGTTCPDYLHHTRTTQENGRKHYEKRNLAWIVPVCGSLSHLIQMYQKLHKIYPHGPGERAALTEGPVSPLQYRRRAKSPNSRPGTPKRGMAPPFPFPSLHAFRQDFLLRPPALETLHFFPQLYCFPLLHFFPLFPRFPSGFPALSLSWAPSRKVSSYLSVSVGSPCFPREYSASRFTI